MDKEQVKEKLAEVIRETLPEIGDSIDMNASITREYGINSISIIRLIVASEEKFGVSFTDFELALSSYETFGDLAAVIAEKL